MERSLGIYIHIPFCVRKCRYCDFLSAPADMFTRHGYVSALCGEIRETGILLKNGNRGIPAAVDTVFIGGGTPSTLDPADLATIMDCLGDSFFIRPDAEITMEMNPGTYSEEMLSFAEKYLNRVSIGLQSVRNEELSMLGRIHTYEDFEICYRALREKGMSNINIDLMSAIPGQTVKGWEETLRKVTSLAPEHISAYSLIVEEGTPFYELRERGELDLPDEDSEREMYHLTKEILSETGYRRYEISNYARPGRECRHNIRYWKREPYLGFGIGAASLYGQLNPVQAGSTCVDRSEISFDVFSGQYRRTNDTDLKAYMERYRTERMRDGKSAVIPEDACGGSIGSQALTLGDAVEEFMFLGLRMTDGISVRTFHEQFGLQIDTVYGDILADFAAKGLLDRTGDRIALTERGLDVGNTVMAEFLLN